MAKECPRRDDPATEAVPGEAIDAYKKFIDATTQADFRRNTAKDKIATLSGP